MEEITNKRILIQEIPGQTVISKLSKSNPNPAQTCHRKQCIPCQHGCTNSKCFQNNIGYMIICSRSPCSDSVNLAPAKLQTEEFRLQLDKLDKNAENKPSAYFGKSFCSGFSRTRNHWTNYTTNSGKQRSFMWHHTLSHHTLSHHRGTIGDNKGKDDYKFVLNGHFIFNLRRQADEGRRTVIFEQYQAEGKINILNSKLDFV